jgi:hypothetical protein
MIQPNQERWLPVPGYEHLYAVSDQGRVRRLPQAGNRVTTPTQGWATAEGYRMFRVRNKGAILATLYVHRVVLEAFVGPCPEGMECRHLDGDPENNRLGNLAWGTHRKNCEDRENHPQTPRGRIGADGRAKVSNAIVGKIRASKDTVRDLSARYGISARQVQRIRNGQAWKGVE